jgi:hypothetical protein
VEPGHHGDAGHGCDQIVGFAGGDGDDLSRRDYWESTVTPEGELIGDCGRVERVLHLLGERAVDDLAEEILDWVGDDRGGDGKALDQLRRGGGPVDDLVDGGEGCVDGLKAGGSAAEGGGEVENLVEEGEGGGSGGILAGIEQGTRAIGAVSGWA